MKKNHLEHVNKTRVAAMNESNEKLRKRRRRAGRQILGQGSERGFYNAQQDGKLAPERRTFT